MLDIKHMLVWEQADWDALQAQQQAFLAKDEYQDGVLSKLDDRLHEAESKVKALEQWRLGIDQTVTDLIAADTQLGVEMAAADSALDQRLVQHQTAYEAYKKSVNASVKALEDADKAFAPKVSALESWRPTMDKAAADLNAAITKANADRVAADTGILNRLAALEAALTVLKATDATLAEKMAAAEAEVVKLKAEDVAMDARMDAQEALDAKQGEELVSLDARLDELEKPPPAAEPEPEPTEEKPDAPV